MYVCVVGKEPRDVQDDRNDSFDTPSFLNGVIRKFRRLC